MSQSSSLNPRSRVDQKQLISGSGMVISDYGSSIDYSNVQGHVSNLNSGMKIQDEEAVDAHKTFTNAKILRTLEKKHGGMSNLSTQFQNLKSRIESRRNHHRQSVDTQGRSRQGMDIEEIDFNSEVRQSAVIADTHHKKVV